MRLCRQRASVLGVLLCLLGGARAAPVVGQSLTLANAADAALATHPLLAASRARVLGSEQAADAARAARLPGAALTSTLTRFQEPMVVAPFHSLDFTSPPSFDRTLLQSQLSAQYTLFDGGVRSARIRAADAMSSGAGYGQNGVQMRILEETVAAYVGVLSARAVLDASTAQLRALEEEQARAERALAAGTAPELEILRAAAALQDARASEVSARARTRLAERSLARLMGADAEDVEGRALADVGSRPDARRARSSTSPPVLQAAQAVAAAEARLAEERGGRIPTVQAGAGVMDFGTVSGSHVVEWQAGLQVSWPLFTGGARGAAVRRAAADVEAAEGDLRAVELEVSQAVDAAETALLEAESRTEALALAVSQWEEVARIEALALQAGSGVQGDLLRAEAGLFQARAGHARARYEAVLARASLARAEGTLDRGWIDESLEVQP